MGRTCGKHCEYITNPDGLHKLQSKERKARGEEVLQNDLLGPGPPPGFWYDMIAQGASHAKHDGSIQSAQQIIGLVVQWSPIYLQIQEELRIGIAFSQTAAAQALKKELQLKVEMLEKTAREVTAMLAQVEEQKSGRRPSVKLRQNAELKAEMSRNQADAERLKRQISRLMSNDWGGNGSKPRVGTGVNPGGKGVDRDRGGNGSKSRVGTGVSRGGKEVDRDQGGNGSKAQVKDSGGKGVDRDRGGNGSKAQVKSSGGKGVDRAQGGNGSKAQVKNSKGKGVDRDQGGNGAKKKRSCCVVS